MIYEYKCDMCGKKFDVWKRVAEMNEEEICDICNVVASRQISGKTMFINAAVEHPEYNAGLGCVTKNRAHRADLAKQRNLVEIGNESKEIIQKYEAARQKEKAEKKNAQYDEALREALQG